MKNSDIQKKFYNDAFKKTHIWKDADFSEDNKYLTNRFLDIVIKAEYKKVLEIGCGNGFLTFSLLKRPLSIMAVDISNKAIENMHRQFQKEVVNGKLKLRVGNLIDFLEETTDTFDLVVGSGIIHHMEKEDWNKLYSLIYKKLKPGGTFSCAPEPNAGGPYKICWRFARYFYKIFGINYIWEVEKRTLNMIPNKLKFSLEQSGFSDVEILPFQSIPYFHSKALAYFDRIILDKIKGRFSLYIIIKGQRSKGNV